jgi:hypothetical protein
MGQVRCVLCGAVEDERSASLGEKGLLCAKCTPRDTSGGDLGDRIGDMMIYGEAGVAAGIVLDAISAARMDGAMARAGAHTGVPTGGLHDKLRAAGCGCERYELDAAKAKRPGGGGYTETWLLPAVVPVQATFGPEGFAHRLGKLFSKELQVGDKAFDDAVFIRTSTPEESAAWLKSSEVRAAILAAVASGGNVAIEGNMLEGKVLWGTGERAPDELFASLVATLPR